MKRMTRAEAIQHVTAPGHPYALEKATVNGKTVRVFKNAPSSLRELFESTATDLPFLFYEQERHTFAQAKAAAARIAHVLVHQCGVKKGDRVAIAMRNYPEWILAFTAITSVGAIAVAMNGHWQADEMVYGLSNCGAKVLLADQERVDRLAERPPMHGLQVLAVRTTRLAAGVQSLTTLTDAIGDVPMPPASIAPDDLATILFTSGSSGHPKGVPSTHRNILSALLSWEQDAQIRNLQAGLEPAPPTQQLGTLLAVPLFHVTGLHGSYLSSYRQQARLVCMYKWDPDVAATLIERERLTSVSGPAAITGDLVRVAQSGRYDLSSLLALGGGGAPRAPEQVRQIHASFANAMPNIGWGMTETNAIGTSNSGQEYLDKPSSSGQCALVLDMKIVDEIGQELAPGEQGELWVRGSSVFDGYWNLPESPAQTFSDGWLRTGDSAYFDEDRFLFIVDRIKDLIIRGGENIGCGLVEAALLMHPDVHEASVYAVPDERLGEEVGATVYGSDGLDTEALRAFLAGHLARFELPRYIVRSAVPLPRTPSGKILKRQIRNAALAELQPHKQPL